MVAPSGPVDPGQVHEGCAVLAGWGLDVQVVPQALAGPPGLGVPVAWGLGFGHVAPQPTIPLGVPAELDAGAGTLTFLEHAAA